MCTSLAGQDTNGGYTGFERNNDPNDLNENNGSERSFGV